MPDKKSPMYYFNKFSAKKLMFARYLRGMSRCDLANKVSKTQSIITAYETTRSSITLSSLTDFVNVMQLPYAFFSNCSIDVPDIQLDAFSFNQSYRMLKTDKLMLASNALFINSMFDYLAGKGIKFPSSAIPSIRWDSVQESDMENLANELRSQFGIGNEPIQNMAELLESVGVRVMILPFTTVLFRSFSFWIGETPCVVLDALLPASQMQMWMAHELAHLILDRDGDSCDSMEERKARRFATCFMLPAESFKKECPEKYRQNIFDTMKQYWRVPIKDMLARAHELGIFDQNAFRSAQIARSKKMLNVNEEAEFDVPALSLMDKAINLFSSDTNIDEMAETVGLHVEELIKILKAQHVSDSTLTKIKYEKKNGVVLDFVPRAVNS